MRLIYRSLVALATPAASLQLSEHVSEGHKEFLADKGSTDWKNRSALHVTSWSIPQAMMELDDSKCFADGANQCRKNVLKWLLSQHEKHELGAFFLQGAYHEIWADLEKEMPHMQTRGATPREHKLYPSTGLFLKKLTYRQQTTEGWSVPPKGKQPAMQIVKRYGKHRDFPPDTPYVVFLAVDSLLERGNTEHVKSVKAQLSSIKLENKDQVGAVILAGDFGGDLDSITIDGIKLRKNRRYRS